MKTYTKIIAGISILASVFAFAYYVNVNAQNSDPKVSLNISWGALTYNVSGWINLGTRTAGFAVQSKDVVSGTFQTNSFVVQDLKWSGYSMLIESNTLTTDNGFTIDSWNVYIKILTPRSLTWDITSNVTTWDIDSSSWFSINNSKIILSKGDDWKINKAAVTPIIWIDIPANQAVGSYSGTLTITVGQWGYDSLLSYN